MENGRILGCGTGGKASLSPAHSSEAKKPFLAFFDSPRDRKPMWSERSTGKVKRRKKEDATENGIKMEGGRGERRVFQPKTEKPQRKVQRRAGFVGEDVQGEQLTDRQNLRSGEWKAGPKGERKSGAKDRLRRWPRL